MHRGQLEHGASPASIFTHGSTPVNSLNLMTQTPTHSSQSVIVPVTTHVPVPPVPAPVLQPTSNPARAMAAITSPTVPSNTTSAPASPTVSYTTTTTPAVPLSTVPVILTHADTGTPGETQVRVLYS